MKQNKLIYIILFISIATAIGLLVSILNPRKSQRNCFVNAERVFSEFTMTKELKTNFENVLNQQNNELDSLAAVIHVLDQEGEKVKSKIIKELYQQKRQLYSQGQQGLSDKYDAEVWMRIRAYAENYCKAKDIRTLYGLTKASEVLYMAAEEDFTDDFLNYINSEYAGENTH